METINWKDQLGYRSRKAFLWLIKGNKIWLFCGESIKGVVAVVGVDYKQNGKWSSADYRLQLAEGVRYIAFREGWESGTLREGLGSSLGCAPIDTWDDLAKALDLPRSVVERFIRYNFRREARDLDKVERGIRQLREPEDDPAKPHLSQQHPIPDIVITRHKGLVEFLLREGYIDANVEIKEQATVGDVKDRHVLGVLPMWLAAEATSVTEAKLDLTLEQRKKGELDVEETAKAFRGLITYVVLKA